MRGLHLVVGVWAVGVGCQEPLALIPSEQARVGARSVMWVWSDPTPTYWLEDLDSAPNFPIQRPSGAMGVRAMFYGCPAAELNLEIGLQPWSIGCVPPTQRRYREVEGRLVPDQEPGPPECSPCLLWPLQVTTTLDLPAGYAGDAGLFLDDDTVLVSAFNDAAGHADLFRLEFNPPSVTMLTPPSGDQLPVFGPLLRDGEEIFAIAGDEYLAALTLGPTHFEAKYLPAPKAGPKAAHVPAGVLVADGDRLLWSPGFGSLWSFTRTGTTGWRRLEREWDFALDPDYSIRTSMERLGSSVLIGVGVSADRAHYESRDVDGVDVPYSRRYFLLRGDQLEHEPLPDVEEPVSVARTGAGPYVVDRRGAAYPVDAAGQLGQRREVGNGSDLSFAVGGQDRLFYAGRDGTFWPVFPETGTVCPAVSVAYGGVLISRGRYLLHNSGPRLVFAEMLLTRNCGLEPVAEEEP